MYDIHITYTDKQDKELLEKVNTQTPAYLHFYDMLSSSDKKHGWTIKNVGAATLDPFVLVKEGDKIVKAFYSENGNAINQLILFLNAGKSKET